MTGEIGCVLNLQEELHKIVIGYQFKRLERPSRNGASFSKELLQKRLYKRNQVLNANSPFVITDEILEHHYHAFQEPWGEGEKVILQKEDIMQYSKEEIK